MTVTAPMRENISVVADAQFPKWNIFYEGARLVVETLLEGCLNAQIIWRDSAGIARLRHLLNQHPTTPQQLHDHAVTMSRSLAKHIAEMGATGGLDGDAMGARHKLQRERAFWRAMVALLFGRRCLGSWPEVAVDTTTTFDGPDDAAADLTWRADEVLREVGVL